MPNYDPIFLTFNEKPRHILRGMDDLIAQRQRVQEIQKRWKSVPGFLFLAGLPFIAIDAYFTFIAGYFVCSFTLITAICWLAMIVVWIFQRRQRMLEAPPFYRVAREVLYTLRDDANPKRPFFGQLDLTGTRQPAKVARETQDALGRTNQLYRDEWLSLKAKLYDGNMLRLSTVRRDKVRKGFWKRSRISGKMKWKAPKDKGSLQEIKVRLSVNPELYDLPNSPGFYPGARIGVYQVEQFDASGGIVSLSARAFTDQINAADILNVLQGVYHTLQRKSAPTGS